MSIKTSFTKLTINFFYLIYYLIFFSQVCSKYQCTYYSEDIPAHIFEISVYYLQGISADIYEISVNVS
jgi:hypothetical protein